MAEMAQDFEQLYYDTVAKLEREEGRTHTFENALNAVAWSTNLRSTQSFRKYARAVLDAADVERPGSNGQPTPSNQEDFDARR